MLLIPALRGWPAALPQRGGLFRRIHAVKARKRRGRRMRLILFALAVLPFMASGFWLAAELTGAGG